MTAAGITAIAALSGLIVGAGITWLLMSVVALHSRIDRLEQSARQRNPYRTNDGLEDAMAIVHDAVWQADATLDYVRARMRQVDKTLQTIRSEPEHYDPDQLNKKRILQ